MDTGCPTLPAIDSCPLAAKSWLTVVANLASAHTGCSEPSFRSAACRCVRALRGQISQSGTSQLLTVHPGGFPLPPPLAS